MMDASLGLTMVHIFFYKKTPDFILILCIDQYILYVLVNVKIILILNILISD